MPRVSQVSQHGRPEYSAVRCLLFGANLTDVGILRSVCLLFLDGTNILALGGCVFCIPTRPRPSTIMNECGTYARMYLAAEPNGLASSWDPPTNFAKLENSPNWLKNHPPTVVGKQNTRPVQG